MAVRGQPYCAPCAQRATADREARRVRAPSGGGSRVDWRQLRAQCLARDPICQGTSCNRRSTHADHILPKADGGRDELANLAGLCHSCHSRKTARTDGGYGNPRSRVEDQRARAHHVETRG